MAFAALGGVGACVPDEDDDGGGLGNAPPLVLDQPPVAMNLDVTSRGMTTVMITLQATDPDSTALTYSVDQTAFGTVTQTLPGSPMVSYTPTKLALSLGDDTFGFTVSDGQLTGSGHVHVHLTPENAPNAFSQSFSLFENTVVDFTLGASDPDHDPLTFTITIPPSSGTLSGTPPNLTYTPNLGFIGHDSIQFSASDGLLSAFATVELDVQRVNNPPTATPQSVPTNEDTPVSFTLAGSDIDGDPLTFAVGRVSHGTLTVSGANVTYTPLANYHGPDSFTFTVSDGIATSAPATVSITVVSVNDPPVANNVVTSLPEDTTATITLVGSDADNDPLTFAIVTPPKNGTLVSLTSTSASSSTVLYTPNQDFNGTDSFTYTVSDGQVTSPPATVSLTITPVDDAPVVTDITVPTNEDTQVSFQLPATDIDTPASQLVFGVVTFPSDGTLTVTTAGIATYTPAANVNGTRTFTFHVTDGTRISGTATATILIAPVNDPPAAADDWVATDLATSLTIDVLVNDSDIEGDALTIIDPGAPANGTVDIVHQKLLYTPDLDFSGVDTFTYTIADPSGATATATVHVGVGGFPVGAPGEVIAISGVEAGNDLANVPAISGDGRYIAFTSGLALLPADTNGTEDVYLYDRGTRTLALVSVASDGTLGNSRSERPALSADGRYITFLSVASNLVAGDTNGKVDTFRHDRVTGETLRVSVASDGTQGNGDSLTSAISDDGNLIAFASSAFNLVDDDANGNLDVFVHDVAAGTTTRVSVTATGGEADLGSLAPAISGDGRFVAFSSTATNLVPGDTNNVSDIFVRDRIAGTTTRVSVSSTGGQADRACSSPSLSQDGRFISFLTNSTTLVAGAPAPIQVYVRDSQQQTTSRPISVNSTMGFAQLSGDGRYLTEFSTGIGVAIRDRFGAVSASPAGASNWTFPAISENGRYVAVLDTSGRLTVVPNPL